MASKPSILHLGQEPKWHQDLYKKLETHFNVIRPSDEERQRPEFLKALKEKRWGDFVAIMRPFWNTGGEMGRWDKEMIPLLPSSVKVYASAGAGFDWVDTDILAERGEIRPMSRPTECTTDKQHRHHLLQRRRRFLRVSRRLSSVLDHLYFPQPRLVSNGCSQRQSRRAV